MTTLNRVTFASGRLVHWSGSAIGWPTACRRVMLWHIPIPTTEAISCPSCLRLRIVFTDDSNVIGPAAPMT